MIINSKLLSCAAILSGITIKIPTTFIVIEGNLRIDFHDGAVHLPPGEMFVVPKGVEHKPYAESEVKLLLIEPRGVLNTGDEGGERTAANDVWI
jgi:mannose-6-phosphate isomerase-like protein (cupin superfamily)